MFIFRRSWRKQMKQRHILFAALAGLFATACTTAELEAISAGLAQGLAEASYDLNTQQYGYNPAYSGPYYAPAGFSSYSGWPTTYSYGQYVGAFSCSHTGDFYTCDSDGDGFADMYGNSSTGSFSSSHLRVNGRGKAFTWDSACGCWEREPAYDGPRTGRHKNYRDYDYD